MAQIQRFSGLKLSAKDRKELAVRRRGQLSARLWRRLEMLRLLDRGNTLTATGEALGCYPREVRRVARRYLSGGLDHALGEEKRPGGISKLDSTQKAALVAMVCGPAPDGRARWTVRLIAEHAVKRGIAESLGRETVRVVLATHDLKPWREKNVVRARSDHGVRGAHGGPVAAVRTSTPSKRTGRRVG